MLIVVYWSVSVERKSNKRIDTFFCFLLYRWMATLVQFVAAVAPVVFEVGYFFAAASSGTLWSTFYNYSAYLLFDRTTVQDTSQLAFQNYK